MEHRHATTDEGFVDFRGARTWYGVIGTPGDEPGRIPLLLVHGGPGVPWPTELFAPFRRLADDGRPVVLYHQLGCGRSDRPDDPALWTVDLFVDELATVRRALGLDRVHLFGLSWGGMLALEYLLARPAGVLSVVLASALFSVPRYEGEVHPLVEALPAHVRRTMRRFEAHDHGPSTDGHRGRVKPGPSAAAMRREAKIAQRLFPLLTFSVTQRLAELASRVPSLRPTAHAVATVEFTRRHLCRLHPLPFEVFESFVGTSRQVHESMWGPDETRATGSLRGWDITDRLSEIDVPALVTSGRYDEVTPAQSRELAEGLRRAEWVLFEHSAHMAIIEEPDRYAATLSRFLAEVESEIGTATV